MFCSLLTVTDRFKKNYSIDTIQHNLQNTISTYNNKICVGKGVNGSVILIYGLPLSLVVLFVFWAYRVGVCVCVVRCGCTVQMVALCPFIFIFIISILSYAITNTVQSRYEIGQKNDEIYSGPKCKPVSGTLSLFRKESRLHNPFQSFD